MSPSIQRPLRIALADDHPIFLIGLRVVVEGIAGVRVIGEANSPHELSALLEQRGCDVVITDFMMPAEQQNDGLRLIERLRRQYPDLPILVVTMLNNAALFRSMLTAGVMGLLSKASLAAELPDAVRYLRQHKTYIARSVRETLLLGGEMPFNQQWPPHEHLSPRELEVVRLLAAGQTVGEIAARLCRSKQTVSAQKVSAMRKLGLSNDASLFVYLQEHGLS